MSYTKTNWQDHVLSRPGTYNVTENQDGTQTLSPAGEILQQGTPMNAANLNKIENGIEAAHNAVDELSDGKVDKVSGKELSSNDYTDIEKQKLSGIEQQANRTVVDSALSDSSTAPVQNKAIKSALDNKVDAVQGKGLSENDYTTAEKNKLSGIETGANRTAVDSLLSVSSENPLQNRLVTRALNKLAQLHGYNTIDDVPNKWQQIQQKIRNGTIQNEYSLGDEIEVTRGDQTLVFEVASFDTAIPAVSGYTHSMMLAAKYLYWKFEFDAAEPSNTNTRRKRSGSNNYQTSNIRQWLNSDGAAGQWWTAQTQYDAAPSYAETEAGFLNGLDPDFADVIGNVALTTINPTIDGGGSYALTDKVFLLSMTEAGLGNIGSVAEGTPTGLYTNNNSRIKASGDGSAYNYYLLRSVSDVSSVYEVAAVSSSDGEGNTCVDAKDRGIGVGVVPAVVIY